VYICIYFSEVSKNWIPLQIPNLALSLLGIVLLLMMPESPRFYISQRRFEKAR